MAYMKSLTVSGQTYQVKDPEAVSITTQQLTPAQQAQARENIGAVDETEIVDKLCPSFTESGSIVTCEPVEGYPLEVEWKTKNLINPAEYVVDSQNTTLDGDVFTTNFTNAGVFVNMGWGKKHKTHPKGTYTVTVVPVSDTLRVGIYVYTKADRALIAFNGKANESSATLTFTADEEFFVAIGGISGDYGTYSYKLQLEEGTTATAYEPYAETAAITRCGKNLFGGNALVDALKSKDKGGGVTVNEADETVAFDPGVMNGGNLFNKFKENTQYTFILYGYNSVQADVTNLHIKYTDGTNGYLRFTGSEVNVPSYIRFVSDNTKTVQRLYLLWANGKTTLFYNQCGIFEGDMSLEEFEAYKGSTFVPGETVTANSGVNTIFADAGLVTVKGKADPVAIISKLSNAILSLGGNV